jgi:hypothetical protein
MDSNVPRPDISKLSPSGLGHDGKLRRMTDEELRAWIESVQGGLAEIGRDVGMFSLKPQQPTVAGSTTSGHTLLR